MSFDDFDQDNPVVGKGEEMLPDRGIPFEDDDLQDMLAGFETDEPAFDLPGDAQPDLFVDEGGFGRDGGMNAAFPMNPDDAFDDIPALPQDEIALPSLDEDIGGGTEMYMSPAPPLVPGLERIPARPTSQHIDPQAALLGKYVTEERLQMLWQRIDHAQRNVRDRVPNMDIAHDLLDQLELARNEFLADIANYEEVEHTVSGVELRLVVIDRAVRDAPYANKLFVYEIAWAAFFGIALLLLRIFHLTMDPEFVIILFSMGLAGLGSVVRAIYALWQHTAQEINFSRQYSMWYIATPILGPFLGIFVFLVMKAGFISLTTSPVDVADPINPYTIYLLAFLTGFQQNVAWDMIRRIKQVFFPENS